MAIFNRILTVLIVLLAITAVVFSYLLFKRRHEFRDRAEKLALSTTEMVNTLDKQSNTGTSKEITFTRADPQTGEPESGSLSWKAFHEARNAEGEYPAFSKKLNSAEELADRVHKQRNTLAEKLYTVGTKLEMPDAIVQPSELTSLENRDQYVKQADKVIEHAELLMERDKAMIAALEDSAETMGESVNADALQTREEKGGLGEEEDGATFGGYQYEGVLSTYKKDVEELKKRCDAYRDTLVAAVQDKVTKYDWDVRSSGLSSKRRYANALDRMEGDFGEINKKLIELERTKGELRRTRNKLKTVQNNLKQKRRQVQGISAIVSERLIPMLQEQGYNIKGEGPAQQSLRQIAGLLETDKGEEGRAIEKFKANVLKVNERWGFAIVNAGSADLINEGDRLLIARGEEFISRAVVTKAEKTHAVVDILPKLKTGEVRVGDRVFRSQNTN